MRLLLAILVLAGCAPAMPTPQDLAQRTRAQQCIVSNVTPDYVVFMCLDGIYAVWPDRTVTRVERIEARP